MKLVIVLGLLFSPVWSLHRVHRIIGGSIPTSEQFPYAVALSHDDLASGTRFCGGSIIGSRWILTAAHCLDGAQTVTVRYGSTHLDQANTVVVQDSSRYILHPDYNSVNLENNLALLNLPSDLNYDDKIIESYGTARLSSFVRVTALGWGYLTDLDSKFSNELYHVNLTTISNSQCMSTFGNAILNSMACASGTSTQGTCRGDSGGPLIQIAADGSHQQVGIASFYSAYGCEQLHPSGFQRTFEYSEWIRDVVDGGGDIGSGDGGDIGSGDGGDNGGDDAGGDGYSILSSLFLTITSLLASFLLL